ncbi:sulfatase-like hydrolase/transferase [Paraburkholderia sp. SOS3]|jgi:glucan phosphoethanolaminetransferase (alkaline phosphatase superfamily)|uniref:sulfatase-like hydrolase/transferase n=1 Tax=Paraburkholderia sp. SOS3 TaxID=1926494 RepID=UPI0018DDCAB9|nr:sulfatase-like hydrolase/transferase [Paraburkholderia sp. SOS3]
MRIKPAFLVKTGLLLVVINATNHGALSRVHFLLVDKRLMTLVIFGAIWILSLAAILAAAFHPSPVVRLFWAVPLSVAGTAAFAYYAVQQSEFFIFDVLNFWSARHDVNRALDFYSGAIAPSLTVLCASFVAFAMPTGLSTEVRRPMRFALSMAPFLPIGIVILVVLYRDGKGSDAMPKQFAPLSLSALAAYKIDTGRFPDRHQVQFEPGAPLVRALVLMVDESVRADHVSLQPGNPYTPEWASASRPWIDFGPAVSGSNCSNNSNALLRFMANPRNLTTSITTNPTVWQYAKAAGFRTVYIDAQAGFISAYGKLQNYMTPSETNSIDRLYKLDASIPTYQLDDELVRITLSELGRGDRVFIYANKNGAHFPYVNDAPGNQKPPVSIDGNYVGNDPATLATYARAVRWSTDRTMAQLTREANWDGMTMIYTSDHGQNFSPGHLTHCSSASNVDAQEGIVPLMVATGDQRLRQRFTDVSRRFPGRASHFAIAPTLLELMGYTPSDIAAIYDESLLRDLDTKPRFVSDDLFGVFSSQANWHDVDPFVQRPRMETAGQHSVQAQVN